MNYELKIALRFLKSGRTQTLFILLGIAVGVSVQIFLGSLITSLQESLVEDTIGNSPHITITAEEDEVSQLLNENNPEMNLLRGNFIALEKGLNNWTLIIDEIQMDKEVKAISPSIEGTGLVRSSGKNQSVLVKGIQLENADELYDITSRLTGGEPYIEGNSILIGTKLSEDLGVGSGGVVNLLTPKGEAVQFLVGGIFDLENESINESLVFMDLKRAQKLYQLGSGITSIEIQVMDPFQSDLIAEKWRDKIAGVNISEWKKENQQLLSALSSQSSSSYTIQFFVILAVTLGDF